jgi:hypothetical protein
MPTWINPTDDEVVAELSKPAARELPTTPNPEVVVAVKDATASGRPLQLVVPGEMTEDAAGRLGMSENTVYAVGDFVPVEGSWRFSDPDENGDTHLLPGEV